MFFLGRAKIPLISEALYDINKLVLLFSRAGLLAIGSTLKLKE
jgi:hypothetical protein